MGIQQDGVYWPYKALLTGSGITISETPTTITIGTTGAGPGGGDMLSSVYAKNGQPGVVDTAVSAQTVSGTVAHATLADSVPWGGIISPPTNFPTDWSIIANKPTTFAPTPHGYTHLPGAGDPIALATTTLGGLMMALSGKSTDYSAGNGTWQNVNLTVGANPLVMNAAVTLNQPVTCNATMTNTKGLALQNANLQINSGIWQVNDPTGAWCSIYGAGSNTPGIALAGGAAYNLDSVVIYKPGGLQQLWEAYYNASGAQVYSAQIVNTYNPTGNYSFRAATQVTMTGSLPGDNTAWAKAPLLLNGTNAGAFVGIGFQCPNYWACALGAYQSGLFLATSSNTFVQLTDNTGHIAAGALMAGVAQANLGYAPVNRIGDTMTGDLWVNKGTAQIIAYQDANNYVRMMAGGGGYLFVMGDYGQNWGLGQIQVQANPNNPRAGIAFKTTNGWTFSLFALDNGHFYCYCPNNGQTAIIL